MLTFPTHLFNPASIKYGVYGRVITGGEALTGDTDVVATDGGGRMMCWMTGIELLDADMRRAWRAWTSHLKGGATRCLVPIADVELAPRPLIGGELATPSGLHASSADPYFPEAISFGAPLIVASITTAAPLRGTQLTINIEQGARLKGGEPFAIDHPAKGRRVYEVERVLSRSGQAATVLIVPPLRQAVLANTQADFDWPSFVATLVPDTDLSPDVGFGEDATVSIAFKEAFS